MHLVSSSSVSKLTSINNIARNILLIRQKSFSYRTSLVELSLRFGPLRITVATVYLYNLKQFQSDNRLSNMTRNPCQYCRSVASDTIFTVPEVSSFCRSILKNTDESKKKRSRLCISTYNTGRQ